MQYGIRIKENYFRRTHVIFVINGIKLFNQIMLMDFNKYVIPYYSPISSKGGSKRKNKKNKLRTRRRK